MVGYMEKGIELGRSFIQPRYWGKRSLDYLWYGIGAYLHRHPQIEYMTGPVSLSAAYPEPAKQLIIEFYHCLFGRNDDLVTPRTPYRYDTSGLFNEFRNTTDENRYKAAFRILKDELDKLGVKVPTLYKQYVELCQPGGCEFLGFNIDHEFSDCVDSMILVHVDAVLPRKRQRYIESHDDPKYRAA
jgi:putative hemolysin